MINCRLLATETATVVLLHRASKVDLDPASSRMPEWSVESHKKKTGRRETVLFPYL